MATSFPSGLDSFTNPSPGDGLSSPSHAGQHADVNDAVEALQAKVGVNGSAVTGSLDYKVANQGLTLVKSQAVGSGVSSVTVTDAFSSTFDNYRIVIVCASGSADAGLTIRFGTTSTGYYGTLYYDLYTGGVTGQARTNNGSEITVGLTQNGSVPFTTGFDVSGPNQATYTQLHGTYYGRGYSGWFAGTLANTTAYTSFQTLPNAGTLTGGTIRVYGYNNG